MSERHRHLVCESVGSNRASTNMDKVLKGEKVEPRVVEIPAQVVTKENFNDPKILELLNQ
jgi:ABC-type sugar transport system substrate-binding protein